jgi:hypothetical protein
LRILLKKAGNNTTKEKKMTKRIYISSDKKTAEEVTVIAGRRKEVKHVAARWGYADIYEMMEESIINFSDYKVIQLGA